MAAGSRKKIQEQRDEIKQGAENTDSVVKRSLLATVLQ